MTTVTYRNRGRGLLANGRARSDKYGGQPDPPDMETCEAGCGGHNPTGERCRNCGHDPMPLDVA